jgi:hypothetical protein
MAALLARRRLNVSVAKSVDEIAQSEQITEPPKIMDVVIGIDRRRSSDRIHVPIGPASRDQRSTAVRQHCEKMVDAVPLDGADHGQRLAFEGMTLARDGHRIRNVVAMGSLWPLLSTRFRTSNSG